MPFDFPQPTSVGSLDSELIDIEPSDLLLKGW